jgi:hypothetical protein
MKFSRSGFFKGNIYYIDEAARPLKFGGCYNVFNNKNEQLCSVYETLSIGRKVVRFFFDKYNYSFRFDIKDVDNVLLGSISKNFHEIGFINICDDQDNVIGRVRGYEKGFNSDTLEILNGEDAPIATLAPLRGPGSRFSVINDLSGDRIATIHDRFIDPIRSIAGRRNYHVEFEPTCENAIDKAIFLMSTIIVDVISERSR